MSILSIGKLRSRRYVRGELKKSIMGWDFERDYFDRTKHCFHKKTSFYSQPYEHQVICGNWAYLPIECVQKKDRGQGKTFN